MIAPLLQDEGLPLKKRPRKIDLLVIYVQLKNHSVAVATLASHLFLCITHLTSAFH